MAESVVDTHVHLAANWRDGQGGLPNSWLASEGKEFDRDWTEIDLLESASAAVPGAMVFVEIACLVVEPTKITLRLSDGCGEILDV